MGSALAFKPQEKKRRAAQPAPLKNAESQHEHVRGVPAGMPLFLGARMQRKCGCSGDAAGGCEECRKRKLAVGGANDPLELEADQVARQVMRTAAPTGNTPQLKSGAAATPVGAARGEAPAIVHDVVRSPGTQLDRASQNFFGPRFGRDFSQVRIHDDGRAAESARSVDALAYTVGDHIVLGNGASGQTSESGRELLAHELTHVVQQGGAAPLVQRTPCRTAAQCASAPAGDPATFDEKADKDEAARGAALAAAPPGSKEAALEARMGQRAVHFEHVLATHGIPLRPEVAAFLVNPHIDPKVSGAETSRCATPPDKFCCQVPAETEDDAATIDIFGPLSEPQSELAAQLIGIGVHEMQHAAFDAVQQDPKARTIGAEKDCDLDTKIPPGSTVEGLLSEVSAETSEFPVFFQNIAGAGNAAQALEVEEQNQAFNPGESLLGAIQKLQCGCSCGSVDSFVTKTVNATTAGWPPDQTLAFLKTMTRRIRSVPAAWPRALHK
jgi:hypothetical protein